MAPERRWVRAVIYAAFIIGGALVFARSVPYLCYLHMAHKALEVGKFEVAEEMIHCGLDEAHKYDHAHSRTAHALSQMGELYADECRYAESAACYESSLKFEEEKKASARERCDIMLRLGIIYCKDRRYDDARNILGNALHLMEAQKDSSYEIAAIEYGEGEVDAATANYAAADAEYSLASTIFLSLHNIDPDLIASCLKRRIIVLRKLNQPDTVKSVERQLGQIKVPLAPPHLWFAVERFGYKITEQLLTLSENELRHPTEQLTEVASPGALSAIAACASQLAPSASETTKRLEIQSVQFSQPRGIGFVPVTVVAHRRSSMRKYRSTDQTFYLSLWVGLGVKTHKPMLAGFHMIGCHARSNQPPPINLKLSPRQ